MLVLSRKPSESIILGAEGKIKLIVLAVNGYQVKLGIEAPRDVSVHREEVYLRIQDMLIAKVLNKNNKNNNEEPVMQAANDDNL